MREYFSTLWTMISARFETLRRNPDAGYSTETVLWIAGLAAAALLLAGIIIAKVVSKANSITL
ncbi:hypothetical protein LWC34_45110 [Kibdelosporangium philippinense]|uniref:DUF2970 domain-containing protein n=1 Tax=Kibdelosporangium philippinense TaxID=211113 RepID=A0ABS8ZQT8_9PSEU|nr:hypothetical protein [Kibdelosporangium philippinense]MCE7009939.1 hypothetical protein [Kibdelosporangium philippinense]